MHVKVRGRWSSASASAVVEPAVEAVAEAEGDTEIACWACRRLRVRVASGDGGGNDEWEEGGMLGARAAGVCGAHGSGGGQMG